MAKFFITSAVLAIAVLATVQGALEDTSMSTDPAASTDSMTILTPGALVGLVTCIGTGLAGIFLALGQDLLTMGTMLYQGLSYILNMILTGLNQVLVTVLRVVCSVLSSTSVGANLLGVLQVLLPGLVCAASPGTTGGTTTS